SQCVHPLLLSDKDSISSPYSQRTTMRREMMLFSLLLLMLVYECSASCRNGWDCRKGRVCCFGRCARRCDVKRVPSGACVSREDCSFNEICTYGFCREYRRWPKRNYTIPDDGAQHVIEPPPLNISKFRRN
uniref:Uncharacterized protein n=1 Tax=Parascaris univalens TaxID=6257 RepID=A0A915C7M4_PARUN